MNIEKYSIGIGDRFGKEGSAQLRAVQKAEQAGKHFFRPGNLIALPHGRIAFIDCTGL